MKTFRYILFAWVILGCGLFTSCKDDEVEYAPLAITRVSAVSDREQAIEQVDLGQYIIVQGSGLNAVSTLLINDVVVDLDNAYITPKEITFSVPRTIPGEVNNLITLMSDQATVTTPVSVFIPDLRVDGMYNEFTPAGETMKVVGDFFDIYGITPESGKLFFGDKEMVITKATADTIYFQLPEDAVAGSKIRLISPIEGEVIVSGKYMEKGNMLCDFDPYDGWGGGANYVSSGPEPQPYSGQYSHFKLSKNDADDWAWNDFTGIAQKNVTYWQEVLENPQDYWFKFEVCTLVPLTKRLIRFYFEQILIDWAPFSPSLPFKTNGEWQTVTIDLADMWKGDLPNTSMLQIMGNGLAEDTDICFDNFRIVPKD